MPTRSRQRPTGGISWSALGAVLGGAALGGALGWSVILVLEWVTFDACVPDPPIPLVFAVTVVAVVMVGVAAFTQVLLPPPRRVWGAWLVAMGLGFGLSRALAVHAEDAASDCTWLLNPPVREPAVQRP